MRIIFLVLFAFSLMSCTSKECRNPIVYTSSEDDSSIGKTVQIDNAVLVKGLLNAKNDSKAKLLGSCYKNIKGVDSILVENNAQTIAYYKDYIFKKDSNIDSEEYKGKCLVLKKVFYKKPLWKSFETDTNIFQLNCSSIGLVSVHSSLFRSMIK